MWLIPCPVNHKLRSDRNTGEAFQMSTTYNQWTIWAWRYQSYEI